jgi:hypothetical protein
MLRNLRGVVEMLRSDRTQRLERGTTVAAPDVTEQVAELCAQVVMLQRLHSTVQHCEVLAAFQEIVINLVGCDELALYTFSEDGRTLRPVLSVNVDAARLDAVELGSGPIGRVGAEGRGWMAGEGPRPPDCDGLVACVALRSASSVVGVLVIWRLLEHKAALLASDRRLLALLSTHAGVALELTRAASQVRDRRGGAAEHR